LQIKAGAVTAAQVSKRKFGKFAKMANLPKYQIVKFQLWEAGHFARIAPSIFQ